MKDKDKFTLAQIRAAIDWVVVCLLFAGAAVCMVLVLQGIALGPPKDKPQRKCEVGMTGEKCDKLVE